MKKILSIIVIILFICCSFEVQGLFFEKTSTEITNTDLGDIFFDQKMKVLMKLSKFPSLSACIIDGDKSSGRKVMVFMILKIENLQRKTLSIM